MKTPLLPLLVLLPVLLWPADPAGAEVPALDHECPGGLRVQAEAGGQVRVNGKTARLTRSGEGYWETESAGVTVSIASTPEGPVVSYAGKGGAHGICAVKGGNTASGIAAAPQPGEPCSAAWSHRVEARVGTGDGAGHGPDVGSDEWMSVVEFKLGLRGKPGLPKRGSAAWCRLVDRIALRVPVPKKADAPAFDCRKVEAGSAEALVCGDRELAALDRRLAGVYKAALTKAANEHPPVLKAEQRGWARGRHDCWKEADLRACVLQAYVRRMAELQARYRLVPSSGAKRYVCDGDPRNEVLVTYFQTAPPTLIAERGDQVSLMYFEPGQEEGKYVGRNESFVLRGGGALVTWGYGAAAMNCTETP